MEPKAIVAPRSYPGDSKRIERLLTVLIAGVQTVALGGCAWLGLTWGSMSYPVTQPGESANVVSNGDFAYATRGEAGIEVLRVGDDAQSRIFAPPQGLGSIDDLAIDGALLFALDAQPPGHLAVFSLADPAEPRLVAMPVRVDVGPFAGVTAAGGRVIVSGGAGRLSLRAYRADGRLGDDIALADLGRGQPDASLDAEGALGFVSTHDWGPYFELTLIHAGLAPASVVGSSRVDLQACKLEYSIVSPK